MKFKKINVCLESPEARNFTQEILIAAILALPELSGFYTGIQTS